MIVAAAAAIFFLLKKVEAEYGYATQSASSGAATNNGYAHIFGGAYFRRMALLAAVNHGSFVALPTLWAGPWMMTVLEMSKKQTAEILFVFNFCLLLAYLGLSWWAPRHVSHGNLSGLQVTRVIAIGLTGTITVQSAMLLITASWTWLLWLVLGVFITVTTLMQTSVSLSFPPSLAGRANTAINLMVFVGAFLFSIGRRAADRFVLRLWRLTVRFNAPSLCTMRRLSDHGFDSTPHEPHPASKMTCTGSWRTP